MPARRVTPSTATAVRMGLLALGVGLCWWLLAAFDWDGVGARLSQPELGPAVTTGLACLAYLFVRSARWSLLVGPQARRAGFGPIHATTALGIALGNFLPLQAGEYLKVEWLARRTGTPRVELAGAFLVERGLDLATLGLLLVTGVGVYVGASASIGPLVWGILGAAGVAIGVTAVLLARRTSGLVHRLLAPARALAKRPGLAAATLALTILSWLLVITSWAALGQTLRIDLGFGAALSLCASVTTLRIASCVPAGIGVDEAGIVGLMPLLGHPPDAAQAYALALRLLDLLLVALALCFLPALRSEPAPTRA